MRVGGATRPLSASANEPAVERNLWNSQAESYAAVSTLETETLTL